MIVSDWKSFGFGQILSVPKLERKNSGRNRTQTNVPVELSKSQDYPQNKQNMTSKKGNFQKTSRFAPLSDMISLALI